MDKNTFVFCVEFERSDNEPTTEETMKQIPANGLRMGFWILDLLCALWHYRYELFQEFMNFIKPIGRAGYFLVGRPEIILINERWGAK